MKIKVLSDLHIEINGKFEYRDKGEDVVVLAGDIAPARICVSIIAETFKNKKVVFVAGNHEFYGNIFPDVYLKLREDAEQFENIFFLEKDEVVIGDIIFLGTTLWSDFNLFGNREEVIEKKLARKYKDFSSISYKEEGNLIAYKDIIGEFELAVDFLKNALRKHKNKKVVVITHNAPSKKAIWEGFLNSGDPFKKYLSTAFASNLDYLIRDNPQIKLWVYGHTHFNRRFKIGETSVVSNQRGYVSRMECPDFDPGLIVEI